jgi:hypothetical protein
VNKDKKYCLKSSVLSYISSGHSSRPYQSISFSRLTCPLTIIKKNEKQVFSFSRDNCLLMVKSAYFHRFYRDKKIGQLIAHEIFVSFWRSHRSLTIIEKITMRYFVFLEIFVHQWSKIGILTIYIGIEKLASLLSRTYSCHFKDLTYL